MKYTKITLTENYTEHASQNLNKYLKTLGYTGAIIINRENILNPIIDSCYCEEKLIQIVQSPEKWDNKIYEISETLLEHMCNLTKNAKTDTEYEILQILKEIKNKG